jgi:hypothetical protein
MGPEIQGRPPEADRCNERGDPQAYRTGIEDRREGRAIGPELGGGGAQKVNFVRQRETVAEARSAVR